MACGPTDISGAERWNRRYLEGDFDPGRRASAFLEAEIAQLGSGDALDIAMGEGRNAVYLAEHGFAVTGVDASSVAIERAQRRARERGVAIETIAADLVTWRPHGSFDLITNIFFLERALFPSLVAALRPGGHLLVEHFSVDQPKVSTFGPKSPDYLLRPDELLGLVGGLRVVYYEDRIVELDEGSHQGKAALVRMVARRDV